MGEPTVRPQGIDRILRQSSEAKHNVFVREFLKELRIASEEGRVIPLDSFDSERPYLIDSPAVMSRPSQPIHKSALDERFYQNAPEMDPLYRELEQTDPEFDTTSLYLIRGKDSPRPAFFFQFGHGYPESKLYSFDYRPDGTLETIRVFQLRKSHCCAPDYKYPFKEEEFHFRTISSRHIEYDRLVFGDYSEAPYVKIVYLSPDGGKSTEARSFPFEAEKGDYSSQHCAKYSLYEGNLTHATVEGGTRCIPFREEFPTRVSLDGKFPAHRIIESHRLLKGMGKFLRLLLPNIALYDLSIEIPEFNENGEGKRVRYLNRGTQLLEYNFRSYGTDLSLSWEMRLPGALISVTDDFYAGNKDFPDRSTVDITYGGRRIHRVLSKEDLDRIAIEFSTHKPIIPVHPGLKLYLLEKWKRTALFPPRKGRHLIVSARQANQLQQILDRSLRGDTVVLRPGIYSLKRSLLLKEKEFLTILGRGQVHFVLEDPKAPVFTLVRAHRIRMEGFSARHATPTRGCDEPVIAVHSSSHVILRHLELNGSGTHGITISRSLNILAEKNYIHNNSIAAFGFQYTNSFHIILRSNRIEKNPSVFDEPARLKPGILEFYSNSGQEPQNLPGDLVR